METIGQFYYPYGQSLISVVITDDGYDVWYRDRFVGTTTTSDRATVLALLEENYLSLC